MRSMVTGYDTGIRAYYYLTSFTFFNSNRIVFFYCTPEAILLSHWRLRSHSPSLPTLVSCCVTEKIAKYD